MTTQETQEEGKLARPYVYFLHLHYTNAKQERVLYIRQTFGHVLVLSEKLNRIKLKYLGEKSNTTFNMQPHTVLHIQLTKNVSEVI